MESIIRNVKDIEPQKREWLERAIGKQLRDNQQIIIQVINLNHKATEERGAHRRARRGCTTGWTTSGVVQRIRGTLR